MPHAYTTLEHYLQFTLLHYYSRTYEGRLPNAGDVKYIFHTKSGPGPLQQPPSESLLDPETGNPVAPGPKHKRMRI